MARSVRENHYSEEFKRNTVAIIKAGLSVRSVARKLDIPVNTAVYWMSQDRYRDVEPASGELLKSVPACNAIESSKLPMLVPVKKEASITHSVKISYCYLTNFHSIIAS